MTEIICTKCGKATPREGEVIGDNTTYVCEVCSEKGNLEAYQVEIAELGATEGRTESQTRRLEFLKARVAKIA